MHTVKIVWLPTKMIARKFSYRVGNRVYRSALGSLLEHTQAGVQLADRVLALLQQAALLHEVGPHMVDHLLLILWVTTVIDNKHMAEQSEITRTTPTPFGTTTYQDEILCEGEVVAQQVQALAEQVALSAHDQLGQRGLDLPVRCMKYRRQLQGTARKGERIRIHINIGDLALART